MRNLLQILARYSNFLVFLALEVVAFILIVSNIHYPKASFIATSNTVVAWQMEKATECSDYFHLRQENYNLMEENALLRDSLIALANIVEAQLEDSIARTYSYAHLQIHYIPARVIQLTRNVGHNYLTINKGSLDGVRIGQGVRNKDGVVGIVCTVSDHFALVMPVIHNQSQISCRLDKNKYFGTLVWNGKSWDSATLTDIASHVSVTDGDSIVTSGLTSAFPEGIPVGVVKHASIKPGDSYYSIDVNLCTDFRKLDFVQVIVNTLAQEQEELNGVD